MIVDEPIFHVTFGFYEDVGAELGATPPKHLIENSVLESEKSFFSSASHPLLGLNSIAVRLVKDRVSKSKLTF